MTPEQARALLRAPQLLAAASATDLRMAERLRQTWPADLVAAASEQAELRERARAKTDAADTMLLTRTGLEQASTQAVAEHRAARFAGIDGLVVDLCCGLGFDLSALARVATCIGVDRDEVHAICAAYNTGRPAVVADVREIRVERAAAAYVDPARRDGDRRGGSDPSLPWCLSLPVARVAVKAAPGLDLDDVPPGWEIEFVAEGRALKEACLWSPAWATTSRRATVLPDGATLTAGAAAPAAIRTPGPYLLDPSPAVTRAGLVAELAQQLGGWQVDPRIAFLSADQRLTTPFGRSFRVEASHPWSMRELSKTLRGLDAHVVEVRRRGLAGEVDDIRQRLPRAGDRQVTLLMTRVDDKPWAFVCTPLDPA